MAKNTGKKVCLLSQLFFTIFENSDPLKTDPGRDNSDGQQMKINATYIIMKFIPAKTIYVI